MRKTKEASGAFLAVGLVLSLVGMWTGWTEAVAAWVLGHIVDLIPGYAERAQRGPRRVYGTAAIVDLDRSGLLEGLGVSC